MSKPTLNFVSPTAEHIAHIAEHVRGVDRTEMWLSHKMEPAEGIAMSVKRSRDDCYVFMADEIPLAIFGVARGSLLSLRGCPWLIGSTTLQFYGPEMARLSRPMIRYLQGGYTLLENWVHADNLVSVRWLKGCGFTIDPAEPHGPFGAMFHRFWMSGERKPCV